MGGLTYNDWNLDAEEYDDTNEDVIEETVSEEETTTEEEVK